MTAQARLSTGSPWNERQQEHPTSPTLFCVHHLLPSRCISDPTGVIDISRRTYQLIFLLASSSRVRTRIRICICIRHSYPHFSPLYSTSHLHLYPFILTLYIFHSHGSVVSTRYLLASLVSLGQVMSILAPPIGSIRVWAYQ